MELIANLGNSRSTDRYSLKNKQKLENVLRRAGGSQQQIDVDIFQKIIQSKNSFFADRIFQKLDSQGSGRIPVEEFIKSLKSFLELGPAEKLQYLFEVYDLNNDGEIQFSELMIVIDECMKENGLKFEESEIVELTRLLFDDIDEDANGSISLEEFRQQIHKQPAFMENLTNSMGSWLLPPVDSITYQSKTKEFFLHTFQKLKWNYIRNNWTNIAFLFIFFTINVILFASRSAQYRENNTYVIIARACGQCLNFNCAFTMVLVLRQTMTWLRTHGFSQYLPIDHHLFYHKMTGFIILMYSLLHTTMHIVNFSVLSEKLGIPLYRLLYSTEFEIGWIGGAACITGWILLAILTSMIISSMPFVRRKGKFEVFYCIHWLSLAFWICLVLHGKNFWAWFLIPAIFFVVECVVRIHRNLSSGKAAYVKQGSLLPSKVTRLDIRRPPKFEYRPGDYVYINIPEIAKFEWHPFSISSAPELDEVLSLHIRGVGDWTNTLHKYFERENEEAILITELKKMARASNPPALTTKCTSVSDAPIREPEYGAVEPFSEDNVGLDNIPEEKFVNKAFELEKNDDTTVVVEMEKIDNGKSPASISRVKAKSFTSSSKPKRKSVRLSISKRSLRKCQTVIVIPTIREDEEDGTKMDIDKTIAAVENDFTERDAEIENIIIRRTPLKVYIDGPYGSPTRHIFHANHAVLIGTGIGVTPFASILQSISYKFQKSRHNCPNCKHSWSEDKPMSAHQLQKVDFIWLNRHQRSLEWFVSLLSQLEAEQSQLEQRFLDIHVYITGARNQADMRAAGLQLALDLMYQKEKRCLITGLKSRTQPGRPDWDKVFSSISQQRHGKVTVFFCGPDQLAKTVHNKCDAFDFKFRKEEF